MVEFITSVSLFNASSLIALLVLLIPIIIHLINPNKATLIWVASIKLIKSSEVKRVFQIKWLEKILLLIRLILFTLITLLLANPIFYQDVNVVDEEHHYFSIDWLKNSSESERKGVENKTNGKNKYYILERLDGNIYSNVEELFDSFDRQSATLLELSLNQEIYIAELEQRTTIPKLTHLYLTNRASNYKMPMPLSEIIHPVSIHVKTLDKKDFKEKISIEIIYEAKYTNEKEMLILALKAIESNSRITLEIKPYDLGLQDNIDRTDLSFVIGDVTEFKKVKGTIAVKPTGRGMIFTQSDGFDKEWNNSLPLELISTLSNMINELDKLSRNERLDGSMVERLIKDIDFFDNNLMTKASHPKSLNKYLIFLFCLFLLLERWIVLNRSKFND